MNMVGGKLLDRSAGLQCLDRLPGMIISTLQGERLTTERVIAACDALSKKMNEAEHLPMLVEMGMEREKAVCELKQVKLMLGRGYLESRVRRELGETGGPFVPYGGKEAVRQELLPLGVLMHIAAGNMDALPVYSVLEGLLTENVNILKLPGSDGGLSTAILTELIKAEPLIADYVFVFDFPSEDIAAMQKMAEVADAVIVWGGDAAVAAVRRMVKPDTRIIEWGHKISFAYVSGADIPEEALRSIAANICDTEQLFCNSCQGIYLDTEDYGEVVLFAERFFGILDEVSANTPGVRGLFLTAQKTLELYTEELESAKEEKRVFRTKNCGVIAYSDSTLVPSQQFRVCWVKPLPAKNILPTLKPYKNHLQTAALVCERDRRSELAALLCKTGMVRVTNGANMSQSYCGIPHDGEFPLRRYMKVVSYEYGEQTVTNAPEAKASPGRSEQAR